MKFFHQLLLASVALGLAAPTMATAAEGNSEAPVKPTSTEKNADDKMEENMDDENFDRFKLEVKSRLDLGMFGGGDEVTRDNDDASLRAGYKATISFMFSSTGKDSLEVGLVNTDTVDSTSYFIDPNYEWASDGAGGQGIELDKLLYSVPALTKGLTLMVGGVLDDTDILDGAGIAYGGAGFDGFDAPTPSTTGVGGGFQYSPSDRLTWSAAYVAENDTVTDKGLFDEDTGKIVSTSLPYKWAFTKKQDDSPSQDDSKKQDASLERSMSVVYQKQKSSDDDERTNFWTLLGSFEVNSHITLSGSFLRANVDDGDDDDSEYRYNIGAHVDDLFKPGNSGGVFYGTAQHHTDESDPLSVVELYYTFQVNDKLEVPVFIDFINNIGNTEESGWSIGIRPTLKF